MADQQFQQNFWLLHKTFEFLLSRVSWRIAKCNTNMRKAIPADDKRLGVTLYLLGDGCSIRSAANIFGIREQSVNNIFQEVTRAIFAEPDQEFISYPKGHHLLEVMKVFKTLSSQPTCVAIDGS